MPVFKGVWVNNYLVIESLLDNVFGTILIIYLHCEIACKKIWDLSNDVAL